MKSPYVNVWNELHRQYAVTNKPEYDDWLEEFWPLISNIETEIIDLGCGASANNTLFLLEKGKKVISCDVAEEALKVVNRINGSRTLLFDMMDRFPFEDNHSNLVIADLSLHYFREKDLRRIVSEIKRVLKTDGYLLFRVNSVNCKECRKLLEENKEQIEPKLFFTKNMEKRFFDREDIENYFSDFKILSINEEGMSRYKSDKIVWKCAVKNRK